jgi:hypothetical protein
MSNSSRRFDTSPSQFDIRVSNIPSEWQGPCVEVIDTAETICIGLQASTVFKTANPVVDCPRLVAELTRLVFEVRASKEAQP